MQLISKFFKQVLALCAVALLCVGCGGYLSELSFNPWQPLQLPTEANLLGLSFSSPQHGWIVGNESTILETTDGGDTWQPKMLDLDASYLLTSVSFEGQEGWVVGQPSILLHTNDDGRSWSRIPLSEKLPGSPKTIVALGPQSAEMTTDIGAIYRTTDSGKSWKAMVEEAVGVVRSIARSPEGRYVAVSSRGSFYSTWEPGQEAWTPHNRNSSRRVQDMGFTQDGRLWMLTRGGQVQFTRQDDPEEWEDARSPEFATSWGLLDLAYRTPTEVWIAGGSGNLLCSFDGGQTWQKDKQVEDVPSNLYKIIFVNSEQGFILGQKGTLLKYQSVS